METLFCCVHGDLGHLLVPLVSIFFVHKKGLTPLAESCSPPKNNSWLDTILSSILFVFSTPPCLKIPPKRPIQARHLSHRFFFPFAEGAQGVSLLKPENLTFHSKCTYSAFAHTCTSPHRSEQSLAIKRKPSPYAIFPYLILSAASTQILCQRCSRKNFASQNSATIRSFCAYPVTVVAREHACRPVPCNFQCCVYQCMHPEDLWFTKS